MPKQVCMVDEDIFLIGNDWPVSLGVTIIKQDPLFAVRLRVLPNQPDLAASTSCHGTSHMVLPLRKYLMNTIPFA